MSNKYDVAIIGAGIGGLVTGNILAKNGMKVLILEKNRVPGGAVTTYFRNSYPIDIIHSLCGLKEGSFLNKMFQYLNIIKKVEPIQFEKSFIYINNDYKPISCYSDFRKYENELSNYFPDESKRIKVILRKITKIWKEEVLKSYYNPTRLQLALYPFNFPEVFKYRGSTFKQFLDEFIKSEYLKDVLSVGWPYLGLRSEKVSALYMICMMGAYHEDGSCFIKGGFGKISEALSNTFKENHGEIIFNTEINKITLSESNVASGVEDKKGNLYSAKKVISNIDSKKTFLYLLNNKNLPKVFTKNIKNSIPSCSIIHAHFIVEADIKNEFCSAGSILLPFNNDLEKNVKATMQYKENYKNNYNQLGLNINYLRNFNIEAKETDFVFNLIWMPANYRLWNDFLTRKGEKEYIEAKEEIGLFLLEYIKKLWTIRHVKFMNILTPISFERWLNSEHGSIYDSANTPQQSLLNRPKHKTPIKNLFLVGAKTFPGASIASAFISAFCLADTILDYKITQHKIVLPQ